MTASRTELIGWVNELLQLNYTKVEQCGSGGAYVQILDSIYGDLPMNRVKMNAKHEYEYVANFKVLQNVFKAKKIDKPIVVEKLVKCKMQDNLEFLQWIKRFWDANFSGQPYDAVARRNGAPAEPPATLAPILSHPTSKPALGRGAAVPGRSGGRTPVGGPRAGSSMASQREVEDLRAQIAEMSAHLEGLEKERDFYFSKLRDIEILAQQQVEHLEANGHPADETLGEIQKILYSTEEGFETPAGELQAEEEETF